MNHSFDLRTLGRHMLWLTALGALGVVSACGDDDDAIATTVPESAPSTVADAVGPDASPDDPYCAIERQIDAHFAEAFEALGDTPTEEQMMQAAQAASAAVVGDGLIEQATAIAPAGLAQDLAVLTNAVRLAAEGDVSGFMTPESDAAGARVDAYCGLED